MEKRSEARRTREEVEEEAVHSSWSSATVGDAAAAELGLARARMAEEALCD
jgi:hypothetical protein